MCRMGFSVVNISNHPDKAAPLTGGCIFNRWTGVVCTVQIRHACPLNCDWAAFREMRPSPSAPLHPPVPRSLVRVVCRCISISFCRFRPYMYFVGNAFYGAACPNFHINPNGKLTAFVVVGYSGVAVKIRNGRQ